VENLLQSCPAWAELEAEHCQWLSCFDPQHLRNWEKLRNNDYEAALCEAAVRRQFQVRDIKVEPNEDLAGNASTGAERRPDFRCSRPKGAFFVEVGCIPIAKVVEETGLPHPFESGARNFRHLNDAIFNKCRKKNSQCSGTDLPTLLAVGTFHFAASARCIERNFADMLLTRETSISWNVNTKTGEGVGEAFLTTKLYSASFLRPEGHSLRDARTSLSGLLLCGFGCIPPNILGILHPCPDRPFNRQLLHDIPFGEVQVNQATGQLCTSWSRGDEE
jgi:hypothetical protein